MNAVKTVAGVGIMVLIGVVLWAFLQLENINYFSFNVGMIVTLALMVLVDLYFKKEKKNNEQE